MEVATTHPPPMEISGDAHYFYYYYYYYYNFSTITNIIITITITTITIIINSITIEDASRGTAATPFLGLTF